MVTSPKKVVCRSYRSVLKITYKMSCFKCFCPTLACTTPVASVVMASVGLLLMWRDVDGGWWLLVDSHAELLDVCKLVLHSGHSGRLVFINSCVAAYAAPKFANDSLYDAIVASSSTAAMPYPCCVAGIAVWLTRVMASSQHSLNESIVLTIGGVSFSRGIHDLN